LHDKNCRNSLRYVHDVAADERDADHESPAGDLGEAPDGVANRNVEAVLSERAVEGVEEALVGFGLLVGLVKVDSSDLRGGDGGAVEREDADGGSRSALVGERLGKLNVKNTGRADTPGAAEDTVPLAVQVGKVGRVGSGGQKSDTAIEGLLRALAQAEACSVAAGHEDHPVLTAGAGWGGAGLNEVLVVGKSQGRHLNVGNLCGGGIDRVGYRRGRGGDGRGGSLRSLCKPALDLADNIVEKRNLLRDGERRQGEKHGRGAHIVLCVWWSARMCRRDCGGGDELMPGGTTGARAQMTQSLKELYCRSV